MFDKYDVDIEIEDENYSTTSEDRNRPMVDADSRNAKLPAGTIIGPYVVSGKLGSGATAVVVRASDPETGKSVAIKVYSLDVDDAEVEFEYLMFKLLNAKESLVQRDAAMMEAQHIDEQDIWRSSLPTRAAEDVFFHTNVNGASVACLVLPHYGPSALDVLNAHDGMLSLRVVGEMMYSTAAALAQLESLQIIHTDVKPENILLQCPQSRETLRQASDVPYHIVLVDYGLAYMEPSTEKPRCEAERLVRKYANYQRGVEIQTREYRAPEVICGMDFTCRADVWSLGCVLYELVVGRYLFDPKLGRQSGDDLDPDAALDAVHLRQMWEVIGPPPMDFFGLDGLHTEKYFSSEGDLLHDVQTGSAADRRSLREELQEMVDPESALLLSECILGCVAWVPHQRLRPADVMIVMETLRSRPPPPQDA